MLVPALFALAQAGGVARAASSAYVANVGSSNISQYDIGARGALTPKAIPTIGAGTGPFGIAASPDGKSVYVTNHFTDDISQFDVEATGGLSPKVPATVTNTGSLAQGLAVSPDGKSVYVANGTGAGGVSQYDVGANGALTAKATPTVSAGNEPFEIAVSPDGASVYVTNVATHGPGGVSQYDVGAGGALTPKATPTVDTGDSPSGIAVSPDGKSVYVANRSGGVSQYDVGAGGALTPKATPLVNALTGSYAIAVTPDGSSVYVTNVDSSGAGALSQYDVGAGGALTLKATPTVDTGNGPSAVVVTPDSSSVYVTNEQVTSGPGGVSQYDVGPGGALTPKATPTVAAGNGPSAIAVQPAGLPSAAVTTPADGATYALSTVITASYSCSPGSSGGVLKPGAAGCSAPVPNGTPIDTSTVGAHTFAVTATDLDGQTKTTTSSYTVTASPMPPGGGGGPPPPGVQSPPRNVTLPSIVAVSGSPNTYTCSPGTWVGAQGTIDLNGNVTTFSFTWQRLTPDSSYFGGYRIETVATGPTYRPSAGSAFALATESWLFRCVVATSNAAGSAQATSPSKVLSPALGPRLVNETVDIRVTGIEVTQGIQMSSCNCAGTLPSRDQTNTSTPGQAAYQGVTMAAGKFTVVRVFANFTQPAGLSSLAGANARLEVFDTNGNRISTLAPDSTPAALGQPGCGACVSLSERANAGASFNFLIPWQETLHRALSFRATVSPPMGLGAPLQCAGCQANTFTLVGVPFVTTATVALHPIPLTVGGAQTPKTVEQVFGDAQTVLPVNVQIAPYAAPLAIDGDNTVQATAAVDQRASDDHVDNNVYPIGVFIDGTPSLGGNTDIKRVLYSGNRPVSIVRDDRPLTSAMHEIGHGLGLPHADTGSGPGCNSLFTNPPPPNQCTGPHPDGTADCGGNSNKQLGEPWPPDNKGRIQGVGLDRRNWDIFKTGSLPLALVETPGNEYYDFMSYCANNNETPAPGNRQDAWISVPNWNRLVAFSPPPQALPAAVDASAAGGVPLRVIATVDPGGKTSLFDIEPGQQTPTGPTTGSPYRFELRDAAGGTLATVVPATDEIHIDGEDPGMLLEATLPFVPSTAAVVVSAGGVEVTRRVRSAHPPTATILSPRRGSRVGRTATTLVRWSARDADGDRLTATVDYSADGGRDWKVVAGDLSGNSVRVPSRALSASGNARLRVRVSDGFDVATATSARLHATGAPPLVRIEGAGRGGRVRADTTLLLRGVAFDDAGRQLTGHHLKWYAGARLLGRGEFLAVQALPTKVNSIRLVATDGHARSSPARVGVKVLALVPAFLVARAPTRVAPKARRVRIVVASTVPAVLTIAGGRHAVDRRPRSITIPVHRGRSILRLKYSLSSPGGITRGTYFAAR